MPSTVVGGTVFMAVALNCSPCSLSLTHWPSATSHSPAFTDGSDPMAVVSSRCPLTFTRSTQKPLSPLWKVTRSIRPESSSVMALRYGEDVFMDGDSFSHGPAALVMRRRPPATPPCLGSAEVIGAASLCDLSGPASLP